MDEDPPARDLARRTAEYHAFYGWLRRRTDRAAASVGAGH